MTISADRKALALLKAHLSEAQIHDLDLSNEFSEGGFRITVMTGRGAWVHGCCIGVTYGYRQTLPAADQALALLLLIRADPRGFERTANREGQRWPTYLMRRTRP